MSSPNSQNKLSPDSLEPKDRIEALAKADARLCLIGIAQSEARTRGSMLQRLRQLPAYRSLCYDVVNVLEEFPCLCRGDQDKGGKISFDEFKMVLSIVLSFFLSFFNV